MGGRQSRRDAEMEECGGERGGGGLGGFLLRISLHGKKCVFKVLGLAWKARKGTITPPSISSTSLPLLRLPPSTSTSPTLPPSAFTSSTFFAGIYEDDITPEILCCSIDVVHDYPLDLICSMSIPPSPPPRLSHQYQLGVVVIQKWQ